MSTDPERRARIFALSLPIVGGMISQNLFNLVDMAMVGALGSAALGAVGFGGFVNFVAIAFITGLANGVQAMVARRHGEGSHDNSALPLNGGLLLSLLIGLPITLIVAIGAPHVFPLMTEDPEVGRLGAEYVQVRVLSAVFIGGNFAFRGYWNGVNQSHIYFRTIVAMHLFSVVANWLLIHGNLGFPALGVRGAALGTALSNVLGFALYTVQCWYKARGGGFFRALPDRSALLTLLRLAGPAGLQSFFFATGMVCLFWIVEKLGTAEVAAMTVLVNLFLVFILPGMAFGLASASLVGQALGRRDPEDARRWAYEVAGLAGVLMGGLALLCLPWPDPLLRLFLRDPVALEIARWPMRIMLLGVIVDTMGSVMMNSLLGAGASRTVMVVSLVFQWCFFLPLAYVVGPVLGGGLLSVWLAQSVYRCLQTGVYFLVWRRGRWAEIVI